VRPPNAIGLEVRQSAYGHPKIRTSKSVGERTAPRRVGALSISKQHPVAHRGFRLSSGKVHWLVGYLLATMIALSMARSASAQVIGEGGTVTVGGTTYRLWGVTLPPPQRTCQGWAAGVEATKHLENLVSGRVVECEFRGKDGQTMAICRADGQDLAAELVRSGLAWAALGESHDYVFAERQARSRLVGVHAHGCRLPL
jgi:endonuclease YncB( thermonuclease family)